MKQRFKSYILISAGLMFFLLQSCSSSPKEILDKNALDLNRSCPVLIDSFTQLDSARYVAGENRFQYYYTLSGEKDNSSIIQQEQKELSQRITEFIKREPAMNTYRRYYVIMEYIYFSKSSGHRLFRIEITPDMYQ